MAQPPADAPEWHEAVIDQFRADGGTTDYYGRGLVLLHHRGARSGVERVTPIVGIKDGDGWLVAASRRGHTSNPAWMHNLLEHPEAVIETPDDGTVDVTARRLDGAERDDAWSKFTRISPVFEQYQSQSDRLIPILRLLRS